MASKPTFNQLLALDQIAAGNVEMRNTGHASFRISGALPQVVGRCVSLGLARWPKGPVGDQQCEITVEGQKALAATRLATPLRAST